MATKKELNPQSMTADIIKTMQTGGCCINIISKQKQFIGHMYILLTGLIVVLLTFKFYFTPPNTISRVLEDCIMLFGFVQICAKYYTSVRNADILSEMLNSLFNEFWTLDIFEEKYHKEGLMRYRVAYIIANVYGNITMMSGLYFCVQAIFRGNKGLVMDIWIPHKQILRITPIYEIVSLFEIVLLLTSMYFSVISLDKLFILQTCFICEQFKMIRNVIKTIGGNKTVKENFAVVRRCVIHNNVILKYVENFEVVYSRLFLPTIGTNFILITITMYGISVEETFIRKITNIFIFVACQIQVFAYCWAGQQIQEEGLKVGEAAYQCNWSDISAEGRKIKMALAMIILRSQRKIELTVGGLMVLSMESFAAVIRATFSFLTFLINFKEK